MAQLPFMDVALWRMPLVARLQESAFETDGRLLWFDAARVIDLYRKNPNEVLRGYFHTIMHCVFRHPFDDKHPERALWYIACDASVEATAIELLGTGFPSAQDGTAKRMLGKSARNARPSPRRASIARSSESARKTLLHSLPLLPLRSKTCSHATGTRRGHEPASAGPR